MRESGLEARSGSIAVAVREPLQPLARRPPQRSATEQMKVDMKYGLASGRIAVHHDAITVIRETFVVGNFRGNKKQITDEMLIARAEVVDSCDVSLWNNQHMHRRFRIDITKRHR